MTGHLRTGQISNISAPRGAILLFPYQLLPHFPSQSKSLPLSLPMGAGIYGPSGGDRSSKWCQIPGCVIIFHLYSPPFPPIPSLWMSVSSNMWRKRQRTFWGNSLTKLPPTLPSRERVWLEDQSQPRLCHCSHIQEVRASNDADHWGIFSECFFVTFWRFQHTHGILKIF